MSTIKEQALELAIRSAFNDGYLDRVRLMLPHQIHLAEKLIRLARQYARLQERQCNEPVTDAMIEREHRLEGRIKELCNRDNLGPWIRGVSFDGDPRGYCVKLRLFSGAYNTLGGKESGYGIG